MQSLCCAAPPPTAHGYIHPEKAHTHSMHSFHVNSPPCMDDITEHETQCAWHNDTWLAGALSLCVSSAESAAQCSDALLTDTGASCSYSQVRFPCGMEGPLHDWVWFTIYVHVVHRKHLCAAHGIISWSDDSHVAILQQYRHTHTGRVYSPSFLIFDNMLTHVIACAMALADNVSCLYVRIRTYILVHGHM